MGAKCGLLFPRLLLRAYSIRPKSIGGFGLIVKPDLRLSEKVHSIYESVGQKMSMKNNHKIFSIVAKTFRNLQPFTLATIRQPISGLKRCRCGDWT